MIDDPATCEFRTAVRQYYRQHGRHDLPWRRSGRADGFDPYRIMVSELMLQQTQVGRVIARYETFLKQFPTVQVLAGAPLAEVLRAWNGLGYNRRAKFLWQAARQVVAEYGGRFPTDTAELQQLPGVGANTAGAIVAYAFDRPAVFVETNIRTVFIHHFFQDQTGVADRRLLAVVAQTLPDRGYREWYWALMDYGTYLKQTVGNLNRHSRTYAKQSAFEGSRRQIRGRVIRLLGQGRQTETELRSQIDDERLPAVLQDLLREQLIVQQGSHFHL